MDSAALVAIQSSDISIDLQGFSDGVWMTTCTSFKTLQSRDRGRSDDWSVFSNYWGGLHMLEEAAGISAEHGPSGKCAVSGILTWRSGFATTVTRQCHPCPCTAVDVRRLSVSMVTVAHWNVL
jgi:hypothetical protein